MLSHISTPYADTDARQLSWHLGVARVPALAVRTVEVLGGRCELRLLSASHQVIAALDGGEDVSEVVACDQAAAAALPATVSHEFAHATYRFRSRVEACGPAAAACTAERLTERYADHPHALVGVYPGSPHAVTAVVVRPGPPLSWLTWHVYPQSGEVAATAAVIEAMRDDR
ncbi:MAG: DUF2617 family protein [Acidimicrobiia bacterium]